MKVLILENIHKKVSQMFSTHDVTQINYSRQELLKNIEDVEILCIRSQTVIDIELLNLAKNLKIIGAFCNGTEHINLEECNKRDIKVFNSPFGNSRSVVELVIAMIINLSRKICLKDREMRQGIWNKNATDCHEIKGKTLGIVGYGKIGSSVSIIAEALGMNIIYHDILEIMPIGRAKQVPFEYLLENSDYITIHTPGVNKPIFKEKEFKKIKKGAFFLNASRGSTYVLKDLLDNLDRLGGSYLDVYDEEPFGGIQYDNLIMTPHIGGSTMESQERIANEVSNKILQHIVKIDY